MHNFKKNFGQNFLKGHKFQSLIVEYLDLKEDDLVIEIGPGNGALTQHLLETGALVNSIEIDYSLLPTLIRNFDKFPNFNLVNDDILKIDLLKLLNEEFNKERFLKLSKLNGIKICGSLPYNISKKIISNLLDINNSSRRPIGNQNNNPLENSKTTENANPFGVKIDTMCFIVQDEVAKEYVQKPPNANRLAITTSLYADIKKGLSISNEYFYPKPKVNGGILIFKPINNLGNSFLNNDDINEIIKLVKIGYISPRKTLFNNLKSSRKWENSLILESINSIGFNEKTRASELSRDHWIKLYTKLINTN